MKCRIVATRNNATRNGATRNDATRNYATRIVATRNDATRKIVTRKVATYYFFQYICRMSMPFRYGELVNKVLFIDREEERERLSRNLLSGQNTMLLSARRLGKSSLVQRVANDIGSKSVKFCFVDMFNIKDEEEFYHTLAREVVKSSSSKLQEWSSVVKKFLANFTPKISIGTDPMNDFSIAFDYSKVAQNYKDLLDLPEKVAQDKNIRIVVCLDEFQNLERFSDPLLFQQRLRASWQHHSHVSYCLYGSKKHLMLNLFQNPQMPFYKFGDMMFLDKISTDHWVKYIQKQFASTGKKIKKKHATQIVDVVSNHSYYVQQLAQLVWIRTANTPDESTIESATQDLLNQNAILYTKEVEHLSAPQISFMKALVNGVENFHSNKVIATYKLGSSSSVSRIKQALEKKEIIDTLTPKLEFIDPMFRLWFERIFCR